MPQTEPISEEELQDLLKDAIKEAYKQSPDLFMYEGIEQAMVFRIGIHLQDFANETDAISDLDIDCEYNKNLDQTKQDMSGKGIRPDLIIHSRGNHGNNLLAVEFKGHWNLNVDRDKKKLRELTSPVSHYRYKLGVLVILGRRSVEFTYYKNGAEAGRDNIEANEIDANEPTN